MCFQLCYCVNTNATEKYHTWHKTSVTAHSYVNNDVAIIFWLLHVYLVLFFCIFLVLLCKALATEWLAKNLFYCWLQLDMDSVTGHLIFYVSLLKRFYNIHSLYSHHNVCMIHRNPNCFKTTLIKIASRCKL